jgi:hypothetical protein
MGFIMASTLIHLICQSGMRAFGACVAPIRCDSTVDRLSYRRALQCRARPSPLLSQQPSLNLLWEIQLLAARLAPSALAWELLA